MKRTNAWWALVAVAILGLGSSGCGGKAKEEPAADSTDAASPETPPAAQEAAAPADKPAPAPEAVAAAPTPAPKVAAAPPKSDSDELLNMAAAPAAVAQAPGQAPAAGAPGIPPTAVGGNNSRRFMQGQNQGGQAPGGGGNSGGMPAGYPQPGGGGNGSANAAGASGPGGSSGGMPAGYPQPGGGGNGSANAAGSSGPGKGGMPAGYPQPGAGGGGGVNTPGAAGVAGIVAPLAGSGMSRRGGMMAEGGGPGAPGGGGTPAKEDFTTETKGAESFLSAVKAKDPELLANAVAKHSQYEAANDRKPLFKGLLEKTASAKELDDLARDFAEYKLLGNGSRIGSGSVKIPVGMEEETVSYSRLLTLRKEKEGWKVQDYGNRMVKKHPQIRQRTGPGTAGKKKGG